MKRIERIKNFKYNKQDVNWVSDNKSFIFEYRWCNLHEKIQSIKCSIDDQPLTENCYFYLLKDNKIQILFPKQQCEYVNIQLVTKPIDIDYLTEQRNSLDTYTFNYSGTIKHMLIGACDSTNQYVFCEYKFDGKQLSVVIPKGLVYPVKVFVVDQSTKNNFVNQIAYLTKNEETV